MKTVKWGEYYWRLTSQSLTYSHVWCWLSAGTSAGAVIKNTSRSLSVCLLCSERVWSKRTGENLCHLPWHGLRNHSRLVTNQPRFRERGWRLHILRRLSMPNFTHKKSVLQGRYCWGHLRKTKFVTTIMFYGRIQWPWTKTSGFYLV